RRHRGAREAPHGRRCGGEADRRTHVDCRIPRRPNAIQASMTTPTGEHQLSILLVDDDEVYRNRLPRAFVDRGYEVRTAHDHDSGVAAATTDSPEFAVVDLKMPGKSGLELVKAL